MFTKKHYDFIAEILNLKFQNVRRQVNTSILRYDVEYEIKNLIYEFSNAFEKDSKRFNREKFINACFKVEENILLTTPSEHLDSYLEGIR